MKLNEYLQRKEHSKDFEIEYNKLRFNFNIGTAVMKARIDKGWSQRDLAEKVGTKQANISNLESANGNPTLKFIRKVFRELELEIHVYPLTGNTLIKTIDKNLSFISNDEIELACDKYSSKNPLTTILDEVLK